MERGSKNKFKMKSSALRAGESIMGRFMAMGKSLGSSKTTDHVAMDPSKYYKSPKAKKPKKEESAVNELKRRKAENKLAKMNKDKTIKDLGISGEIKFRPSEVKPLNKY